MYTPKSFAADFDDIKTVRFGCSLNQLKRIASAACQERARMIKEYGGDASQIKRFLDSSADEKKSVLNRIYGVI